MAEILLTAFFVYRRQLPPAISARIAEIARKEVIAGRDKAIFDGFSHHILLWRWQMVDFR